MHLIASLLTTRYDSPQIKNLIDCRTDLTQNEVKYFISAVTKQVIERHLIHNLAEETLSPMIINDMADGEVAHIAAEPEEVTHKRDFLEAHKAILEEGQAEFRRALGSYK